MSKLGKKPKKMRSRRIFARIPHPALWATFPPGEGIVPSPIPHTPVTPSACRERPACRSFWFGETGRHIGRPLRFLTAGFRWGKGPSRSFPMCAFCKVRHELGYDCSADTPKYTPGGHFSVTVFAPNFPVIFSVILSKKPCKMVIFSYSFP